MAADDGPSITVEGPLARRGGRQPYESLVLTLADGNVQRIHRGTTVLVTGRSASRARGVRQSGSRRCCGSRLAGLR